MRAALTRPAAVLVAVVALGAGGLAAADATQPRRSGDVVRTVGAPARAPLDAATAVCPDPVGSTTAATRVVATTAGALGTGRAAGSLVLTDLAGPTAAPRVRGRATGRGEGVSVGVRATLPPTVVTATGGLAPGLAASQSTRTDGGDLRGLSSVACAAPTTTSWFVGSGAAVGRRGRLVLTNPGTAAALVDVALWGPAGPVPAPAAQGVVVAPGARRTFALDALAPGVADLSVRVTAREGRVAAALRDSQLDGLTSLGTDWVPLAVAPARRVVVPGVTGSAGSRVLHLLVPGAGDAIVQLSLVTADGTFAPQGQDVLTARAGRVTSVDLTRALGGAAAAVVLTSDAPLTASLVARRRQAGTAVQDFSWTAATRPVPAGGAALVPDATTATGRYADLVLTAAGAGARVRLTPLDLSARRGPARTVAVPAGTTLRVPLTSVSRDPAFVLLVEPLAGSGAVAAATTVSQLGAPGPLVTAQPLAPVVRTVAVPSVRADLLTGSR